MDREAVPDRSPLASLEWLKLVAAYGIVMFHCGAPGARAGYGGLPVFMILTTALAARSARGRDWRQFRAGRLRRLLVPWVGLSLLYALLRCYLAKNGGQPLFSWLEWNMLLAGTYSHLWYLPFAAVVALAVGWCASRARSRRAPWLPAALGAAGILVSGRAMWVS